MFPSKRYGNEPQMESPTISSYTIPQRWIRYDFQAVFESLVQARTAGEREGVELKKNGRGP